jgi:hypothetical protein
MHFWHAYQSASANCTQNPANPSCSDLSSSIFQTTADKMLVGLIPTAVLFLPIILGVFWGAPLLAKEYADGTNSLAWTQSVSRRKWLTVKLVWTLVATVLFMGAFTALNTWWSRTPNAINMDRFANGNVFGEQGLVPAAITLFAVSWGIMFGAWFRKVMVAVGVTLGVYIAAAHIVVPNLLRPNYVTPVSVTAPVGPALLASKIPKGAWVTSQLIYDKNGKAIYGDLYPVMPPECQKLTQDVQVPDGGHIAKVKASGADPVDDCLNHYGFHQVAKYQPSYRYWDFQRIEAVIYLGLTAVAVAITYGLVLRRDA